MSRPPAHPYLDAPPIAMAHRGGDVDGLENSMRAFQHAVDLGYDYLETDVHATADGVLVAFHDDVLDRVTDRRGAIADLTWDEVSRARIRGTEPIPRLEELLASFPDARLNLDVKADTAVAPLIRALRRDDVDERVCIGSFSDARLAEVREAHPQLCRSAGPAEARRLKILSRVGLLRRVVHVAAHVVQVPVRHGRLTVVDAPFVATCHELGLQVHVWTVNDEPEMRRLLDLGVDGIVTDATDVLRDVLIGRGEWRGESST